MNCSGVVIASERADSISDLARFQTHTELDLGDATVNAPKSEVCVAAAVRLAAILATRAPRDEAGSSRARRFERDSRPKAQAERARCQSEQLESGG